MASITIDVSETLNNYVSQITLESKQGQKAVKFALKDWSRWVRTQLVRIISREMNFPQAIIRGRSVFDVRLDNMSASVWLGLNPVRAHYVGKLKPAPEDRGSFVKDYYFEGGFVVDLNGLKLFKRRGDARLKIDLQTISISAVGYAAIDQIEKRARLRLRKVLIKKINQFV